MRIAAGDAAHQDRAEAREKCDGKLEGDVITCPWHNSQFDMCSGKNLDWVPGIVGVKLPSWSRKIVALGKEPHPIQSFKVTEEEGKLYVEL